MHGKNDESMIRQKFQALEWVLDERLRRLVAAAEAEAIGYGGPSMVSRATGVSRRGIRLGAEELKDDLGYSLKANKKTLEGISHPDRDAQFEYINRKESSGADCHQQPGNFGRYKEEGIGGKL